MTRKILNLADAGTTTEFGSNDLDYVNKLLTGEDQSSVDPVDINTNIQLRNVFRLTGFISPAQITANQNDYAPTGLSSANGLRLSTDASRNITGLQGGSNGRIMVIHNIGSQNIVLSDESASSTAANRFALNASITLGADQAALLQYDVTSSRWRCIATSASSGGGGGGAPVGAQYLTLAADVTLTDERVLTAGTNIVFVDAGAGSTLTVNVPDASTTVKGAVELATDGEVAASLAVQANDARLSNSRAPTAHNDNHVSGGGDAFQKGDLLIAEVRYLEAATSDPTSNARRHWISGSSGEGPLKFWDNQSTPVKHIVVDDQTSASGDLTGTYPGPTVTGDAITFAKMQNIATDRLIGRDTASSGDPEEISVSGGLEFSGSGAIQRSALTGDVTASAASNSTTIANDAVSYAKMQNVSAASKLLGRGDSGSGDPQEITLGTNLSMSGTTLNATAGGSGDNISVNGSAATDADFDDATPAAPTDAVNVKWQKDAGTPNNISAYLDVETVTNKILSNMAANTVKANNTGSTGDPVDVSVGTNTVVGRVGSNIVAAQLATGQVADDAITYAKIQNVSATDRLLGRDTAAAGDIEELTASGGIEFTGTGIQTSAFTGDVTKSAGGTATTLANTLAGDKTFSNAVSVVEEFALTGDISPSQITSNQNDYAPTGIGTASVLRLSTDASRNITGITTGADGRVLIINNVGSQNIVLKDDDGATSTAANRFEFNTDITLKPSQSIILQYDSTTSRWRGIGTNDFIGTAAGGDLTGTYPSPTITTNAITTTKITDANVTLAKIANIATSRILGRTTASSGVIEELTAGSNLSLTGGSLNVASTLTGITLTTPTLTTPTTNGEKLAQVAKTANYTMTATDYVVRCDASGGAFTITLPASGTAGAGTIYKIIRTDVTSSTNLLTVDANSTETIDGLLTWKLFQGEFLVIMSDGTNWVSIAHSSPSSDGYFYLKNSTNNRRYTALSNNSQSGPSTSTTSPAANTLWALPFVVNKVTKFDTISFSITTSQASQNARAGIYFDNGNCYPGALIFDTGSISTASTGVKDTTITSSLQIFQPGLYWLAWETSATTIQITIPTTTQSGYAGFGGTSSAMTGNIAYGYSVAHTFGALPDPYTAAATLLTTANAVGAPVPSIGLRPI